MMANRRQLDPYRAVVRYHDLEMSKGYADALFTLQIDSLCRRGNPNGCRSGFYRVTEDLYRDEWRITLYFDPSVWTGHDGRTPADILRPYFGRVKKVLAWLL